MDSSATTQRAFSKVLIANRGEISRRVQRTCRDMGISTVAVFSDADANALFVAEADEAVRIGAAPPVESYLNVQAILRAAATTGADAIHPGYGFLSENGDFAEACEAAGYVFIGPSADVIRAMGDKRAAKQAAREAGVPVVPGYDGEDQDPALLERHAKEIGFPLLVKARAGGGGKGMKIVSTQADLKPALESARREAESAFGDGALFLEKLVQNPRHIEIQIFADGHGQVVHLGERDCSVQRRYQKVIEESPSPVLDDKVREEIAGAAVSLAKSVGYRNAGTVEFLYSQADKKFYFLEVNTRLQVEHPVTECVTGLDLVREQIRVAEGKALSFAQADIEFTGHAMEVRIYAEDVAAGMLPTAGPVVHWAVAGNVREDGAVRSGDTVSPHYDPMLAKIIAHGADRDTARRTLIRSLSLSSMAGLPTNRDLLISVLTHEAFASGGADTQFLETTYEQGWQRGVPDATRDMAAMACALYQHARHLRAHPLAGAVAYRNNRSAPQRLVLAHGEREIDVCYAPRRDGNVLVGIGGDLDHTAVLGAARDSETGEFVFELDGVRRRAHIVTSESDVHVLLDSHQLCFEKIPRFPDSEKDAVSEGCVAPMPAKVIRVHVGEGEQVTEGQVLIVLEAMKMEHTLYAVEGGTVEQVLVAEGEQVDSGQSLVTIS